MNKFGTLRKINQKLKYLSVNEYIGVEVPIDISKRGEIIGAEIKALIENNLNLHLKGIKNNNIEGTIAKYGMIDLNFEIENNKEIEGGKGFQILQENGWIEKENSKEFGETNLSFLRDMISEIEEQKIYLKIYATSIDQKGKWFKEKTYLLKQMLRGEKIKPLPEDRIQIFRIENMCYTNYSGIWLWKYFYM